MVVQLAGLAVVLAEVSAAIANPDARAQVVELTAIQLQETYQVMTGSLAIVTRRRSIHLSTHTQAVSILT